jgi:hypothetical protein
VCAQAAPPKAGCVLVRLRDCVPAPHDVVHVDQAPKLGSTQSTGHACALQLRVSAECGQATPPLVGSWVARLRSCEPEPHEAVQVDQASKAGTTQSTGHAWALHDCISALCGQALPPLVGATWVRLRSCEPMPHEAVQVVQAPKVPTSQSAGHAWALQARVSAECGQTLPPSVGSVFVRLRFCEPVPHDVVQVDQVAGNEPSTQSTGHAWALHERASDACGHATPPFAGSTMARLRDCEPESHDLVQAVQAPKVPTSQSAAHAWVLQARVSAECGHAAPPNVGSTVARLRFCEPVPHDLVQVDQAPKAGTTQSVAHAATLQLRVSARYGHT